MDTIGDRIKHIRKVLLGNKSQSELAELLGLKGKTSVSHWESNVSTPEVYSLIKLADMAGVSIDWILKGGGPPTAIAEPATEYRVKKLEKEVAEKEEEIENLRSQLGEVDTAIKVLYEMKQKRRK